MEFVVGTRVTADVLFLLDGVPVDPATVAVAVRAPDGDLISATWPTTALTRADTGRYRHEFLADVPGAWWVRFTGTGPASFVSEAELIVEQTRVPQRNPVVWPQAATFTSGSSFGISTGVKRAGAAALVSGSQLVGAATVSSFTSNTYYDTYSDTY